MLVSGVANMFEKNVALCVIIIRLYIIDSCSTEQRRIENKVKRLKEKYLERFLNQLEVKGKEKPLIVYEAVKPSQPCFIHNHINGLSEGISEIQRS
jgi:hypothetical protein